MTKKFDAIFDYGDCVFVKTDLEQRPGIITGYRVTPGELLYEVSQNDKMTTFYDFELSIDRDILLTTTN